VIWQSILPEVPEPGGRKLNVSNRVLDVLVPEVALEGAPDVPVNTLFVCNVEKFETVPRAEEAVPATDFISAERKLTEVRVFARPLAPVHAFISIDEQPHDLATVIDAKCLRAPQRQGISRRRGQRVVDRGEGAAAQQEAVLAAGVLVVPDDLTGIIDAEGPSASGGEGIVDCCEGAVAVPQKPVDAARVGESPHDLSPAVDAGCLSALGSRENRWW
jgi:hypothetical protein